MERLLCFELTVKSYDCSVPDMILAWKFTLNLSLCAMMLISLSCFFFIKSYKQGGDKDGGNQPRETFFSVMVLKERKKKQPMHISSSFRGKEKCCLAVLKF